MTLAERHRGEDRGVLARRHALYQEARARMLERWPGTTRNWDPVGAVAAFNPEREQEPQPLKQAA
jgi:putative transposase